MNNKIKNLKEWNEYICNKIYDYDMLEEWIMNYPKDELELREVAKDSEKYGFFENLYLVMRNEASLDDIPNGRSYQDEVKKMVREICGL